MHNVAETVRKLVNESSLKRTDTGESLGNITVSIGYECARSGDTPGKILDRADKALSQAKLEGRNRVFPYKG